MEFLYLFMNFRVSDVLVVS